eukprot:m.96171 g.96171  ORF g.96171 m.96171 type:complete len:726 (+) comp26873_c1_seq1:106-2283(+)
MATPTAVFGSSTVDTLASERLKSEGYLSTKELATWCAGSQKSLDSKLRIAEALKHDVDFQKLGEMEDIYLISKKERYILGAKKYVFAWHKIRSGAIARSPYFIKSKSEIRRFMMLVLGPDAHTMAIHDLMFLPTLRNQTSPEQKRAWLPAAEARAILGCYAQTEIGHGSDVRSLETLAVYNHRTATFDLHSPTQTSTKWWPAALGRTATHAIVHARLILSTGVDYGVKPFFVQLRDLKTHKNLPGIESGDIGPTLGIEALEEGWCRFTHRTLPKFSLLARFGHINDQGEYVQPPQQVSKRGYATMMLMRANMVVASATFLGRSATIAIRYCSSRRQFRNSENPAVETQVLDYPQVQMRTLPWLAAVFALKFTGVMMMTMHEEMERRFETSGDTTMLLEVHAIGSCLKAVTTTIAVDGTEELRRTCGGHGYSTLSGLSTIFGNAMVNFTGEGENYMIIQQASQHLLKCYLRNEQSSDESQISSPYFKFIRTCASLDNESMQADTIEDLLQLDTLVRCFEHRAGRLLAITAAAAQGHHRPLTGPAQWEGIRAAWAFGELMVINSFVTGVVNRSACMNHGVPLPEGVGPTMSKLCQLFALDLMCKNIGDFMQDGYVSPTQYQLVQLARKSLLEHIRPCAVGLVDAFGYLDMELVSAIGSENGDVYGKLLGWAKRDPMNEGDVIDQWDEHYGKLLAQGRIDLLNFTGQTLESIPAIDQTSSHTFGVAKL